MAISDDYRIAALKWSNSDGRARRLEALKEPRLAKLAKALEGSVEGKWSVAASEREVRATDAWHAFIEELTQARTLANADRAEMDALLMRHEEALGPSRVRAA